MFKYIFFDLDGTLTDSSEGILKSLVYSFEQIGEPCPSMEVLKSFIGPPLTVSYSEQMHYSTEKAELAIKKYRERYEDKGIFENYPYEGIKEVLGALKEQGFILAVATSKPEHMSKRICDHFGLTEYFATISGAKSESDDKAAVIIRAMERLGLTEADKESILMIGDRKHDIIGAHNCQIKCLGVGYGFAPEGEFEQYGADSVVENVEDILTFLIKQ